MKVVFLTLLIFITSSFTTNYIIAQENMLLPEDTIECYGQNYHLFVSHLQDEDYSYQFATFQFYNTKEDKFTTPQFSMPICSYSLKIDANMCYLEQNQPFAAYSNNRYGMMDMTGKVYVPFKYDLYDHWNDSVSFFHRKKSWYSYKDDKIKKLDGEIVGYSDYQMDFVLLKNGDTYTLFNSNFAPLDSLIHPWSSDLKGFKLMKGCDVGMIDNRGNVLIYPSYEDISIQTDLVILYTDDKVVLANTEGKILTDPIYDDIENFAKQGVTSYKKDEKFGLLTLDGKEITPPLYEHIYLDKEGYFPMSRLINGKRMFGFLNAKGEEVIEPIYHDVSFFQNGLAHVSNGSKYGYINEQNELVIDFQFDKFGYMYFYNGTTANVLMNGDCFQINRKGEILGSGSCR